VTCIWLYTGEAIRPGALQLLEILLQETLLMPVYRDHCEWVHPLYEAHVRPTLVTFYNSVKPGLEHIDRCEPLYLIVLKRSCTSVSGLYIARRAWWRIQKVDR